MPKLPAKFDDICKTGKSVLDDDYKISGQQLEAKQKTNLDGAISTITVDLQQKDVFTPAKLSWKFPKPFGIAGFAIDKFEYDKGGSMKLECSMKKEMHRIDELTLDAKTDCKDTTKATVGLTYTGVKDALLKFETKPTNFMDFTGECLYGVGPIAIGAQFKGATTPNVGVSFTQGNLFASIMAKKSFADLTGHVHYKATPDIAFAATGTQAGAWTVGGVANIKGVLPSAITAKAKIDNKLVAYVSCKTPLVKGFTATLGGSYGAKGPTYGVKLALE